MKKNLREILSGSNGVLSSKRIVGVIGSICLFTKLFINATPDLINAVLIISATGLGLTTAEKIAQFLSKKETTEVTQTTE